MSASIDDFAEASRWLKDRIMNSFGLPAYLVDQDAQITTADALLAAIRATPDDDLARLAYADYLEEMGHNERAKFIRSQVQPPR